MKLIMNITLSLIFVLLPAISAAKNCCCADLFTQNIPQEKVDSDKKKCHEELELSSSSHSHTKCQCDHQVTNSLPSITTHNITLPLHTAIRLVRNKTPLLFYSLDNIYRPPISS